MTTPPPIVDRLELARRAAVAAGEQSLELARTQGFGVERKPDGSEVTDADRAAETLMRTMIAEAFPEDGILGEEHGEQAGTSGYRWVLDPIDGTTSFVHGVPLWGVLVAVEHEEHPVAGVIHMPALDEMVYAARGGGAWHRTADRDPVPARVSNTADLGAAMVNATSLDYFDMVGVGDVFTTFAARAGKTRGWSDCYGLLLLATGRVDLVVEPYLHPWDIAPMLPIIAEAGGRHTDWNGVETAQSPHGISSNGHLHDAALELVRGRR